MSAPSVAWPAGSAERPAVLAGNAFGRLLGGVAATAQAELRKLRPDHVGVFTRSAQPLLRLIPPAVRTRQRFMGIGQLVMMPLFFASSALYPLSIMPGWLHVVARINPLTYEVQGLRQMLVGVGGGGELWLDFLVVLGFLAAMVAAATRAYPRAIL